MLERMLYSYYVIRTRLVIVLFALTVTAIILSARNIFPTTLVLVTCMSYFNLTVSLPAWLPASLYISKIMNEMPD